MWTDRREQLLLYGCPETLHTSLTTSTRLRFLAIVLDDKSGFTAVVAAADGTMFKRNLAAFFESELPEIIETSRQRQSRERENSSTDTMERKLWHTWTTLATLGARRNGRQASPPLMVPPSRWCCSMMMPILTQQIHFEYGPHFRRDLARANALLLHIVLLQLQGSLFLSGSGLVRYRARDFRGGSAATGYPIGPPTFFCISATTPRGRCTTRHRIPEPCDHPQER